MMRPPYIASLNYQDSEMADCPLVILSRWVRVERKGIRLKIQFGQCTGRNIQGNGYSVLFCYPLGDQKQPALIFVAP